MQIEFCLCSFPQLYIVTQNLKHLKSAEMEEVTQKWGVLVL